GAIGSGRPCLRGTCGTQDCFSISLVTQVRRFFFTASPGILLVSLACARWRVRRTLHSARVVQISTHSMDYQFINFL
ncbi:hypothetical protein PC118_g25067, partial [Phytophthora cactorum]